MIRLCYSLGTCTLTTAIIVLFLCGRNYIKITNNHESDQVSNIINTFNTNGNSIKNNGNQKVHPLIQEAQQFAILLNPPKPPQPTEISIPKPAPKPVPVVVKKTPPDETVKFDLIATSYNELKPNESLALVSEPGKESNWIKQGDTLGVYILKSVEHKAIVFENGDKTQRITVGSRVAVAAESQDETIHIPENTLVAVSDDSENLPLKPVTEHKSSTRIRKPLLKLGPQRR